MHVFYLPRSILSHSPPHSAALPPPAHPPLPDYGPQLWQASVLSLTLFIAPIIFISVILIAGQDAGSTMVSVCLCVSVCMWVCQNMSARVCVFSVCCYCQHVWVSLSVCVHEWMCVCIDVCVCASVSVPVWMWSLLPSSAAAVPVLYLLSLYQCECLPLSFYHYPSLSLCPSLSLTLLALLTFPRFAPLPLLARLSTVRSIRERTKERKKEHRPAHRGKRSIKMCLLSSYLFYSLLLSHILPAAVRCIVIHPYSHRVIVLYKLRPNWPMRDRETYRVNKWGRDNAITSSRVTSHDRQNTHTHTHKYCWRISFIWHLNTALLWRWHRAIWNHRWLWTADTVITDQRKHCKIHQFPPPKKNKNSWQNVKKMHLCLPHKAEHALQGRQAEKLRLTHRETARILSY